MSLLIEGGRIVTASDDYLADVFIENETITLIGESLDIEADQTIDAPRPTRTAGRKAMAKPMAIWIRANKLLTSMEWRPIVAPDQLIGWAMNEGLPEDIPEIIRRPKSLVKK